MFIKKLEIPSFRKLKNFKLDFSNTNKLDSDKNMNLTIIIGENGTAKTTIFEAIIGCFLNKEHFNQIGSVEYSYEGKDFVSNENKSPIPRKVIVSTYTPIDKLEEVIKDLEHTKELRKTNIDRLNLQHIATRILKHYVFDGKEDINSIFDYVGYRNPDLHLEVNSSKLGSISGVANRAITRLMDKYEDVSYLFEDKYKKHDFNDVFEYYQKELNLFKENLEKKGYKIEVRVSLNRGMSSKFEAYLMRHKDDWEREIDICSLEVLFVLYKMKVLLSLAKPSYSFDRKKQYFLPIDIFNLYHGGAEALRKDLKLLEICSTSLWKEFWIVTEKNKLPLSMLSSGELSLFLRIFDLYDYVEHDSIILIDEPETHLHPKWIKGYVKILNELLGKKRCHVIIATHSPLIVSDVPKNSIVALKNYGGFIEQVKIRERTLGLNYDEILSEVFGLDDDKGNMVHEYAKVIEKALENDEFDKALEIYSQMADSDIRYKLYSKLRAYQEQKGERDV
ncbi:AAA family ATPase (plasmid) [Bacillus cereus]|uniref:AAA family ATPase n=1 Tax=Bacillus cereus TaxID=1396 RepID=UPI0034CD3324|nr:AAA family ATPase [Bacillus cereus]